MLFNITNLAAKSFSFTEKECSFIEFSSFIYIIVFKLIGFLFNHLNAIINAWWLNLWRWEKKLMNLLHPNEDTSLQFLYIWMSLRVDPESSLACSFLYQPIFSFRYKYLLVSLFSSQLSPFLKGKYFTQSQLCLALVCFLGSREEKRKKESVCERKHFNFLAFPSKSGFRFFLFLWLRFYSFTLLTLFILN